jgi:hypothetical protein
MGFARSSYNHKETEMSKKITWFIPLVLVAMPLLVGFLCDQTGKELPQLGKTPAIDLSAPRVYKADSAAVSRYFDTLECPSTGKVTVTIQPDYRAKIDVFSPDVTSTYVDKVSWVPKCNWTGDMIEDIYLGLYDPTSGNIVVKTCSGGNGSARDGQVHVSATEADGSIVCGSMHNGKFEFQAMVTFDATFAGK